MTTTTFSTGTLIESPWLQDVNDVVYGVLNNPSSINEFVAYLIANGVSSGSGGGTGGTGSTQFYYSLFTGDDSTVTFELATYPGSIAHTIVSLDGVIKSPTTDYTLNNKNITFTTAPGTDVKILVQYSTSTTVSTTQLSHTVTMEGGETTISLPYTYSPGSNSIAVYCNGLRLYTGTHFTETSTTSITLTVAATADDVYMFVVGQLVNDGDTIVVADDSITANKLASNSVTTAKIADNNVTYAKLPTIPSGSFMGRSSASTGVVEAVTINSFSAETSLDNNADYVLVWDASASKHVKVLLANIVASGGLGEGQTWTNVTSSRAANTTYQNTTGKPIQVSIIQTATLYDIEGSLLCGTTSANITIEKNMATAGNSNVVSCIVPNNHYYKYTVSGISGTFSWAELR